MNINKKLLPMKGHFFFFNAGKIIGLMADINSLAIKKAKQYFKLNICLNVISYINVIHVDM